MTTTDYQRAIARTVRRGDCRVWTGPLTSTGAPRLEVIGYDGRRKQYDARRVVLEHSGELRLPPFVRLENRCDTKPACLTPAHVRHVGEDDRLRLECPECGRGIDILKTMHRAAYCPGSPEQPHPARRMVVTSEAL